MPKSASAGSAKGKPSRSKKMGSQSRGLSANQRKAVTKNGVAYSKITGLPVSKPKSAGSSKPAPSASPGRSAGFNPFGVPAGQFLDRLIDSKRKK